ARCWLAATTCLFVLQNGAAQSQMDIEDLLQQRGQAGQDVEAVPQAELSTNLPQTTESTADAADLLGTDYTPDEDAMFGEQLFQPGTAQTYGVGFNEDYVLAIGDRVSLRMWGAFPYQDVQVVDPQGNVFLPNVGPIKVAGVRN